MSSDRPAHGIPLQRLIALAIVASMLLLTLSLLLQGRHGLRQAMISAASHDVGRLGGLIGERAERLLGPARSALYLLRHDPLAEATSLQQRLDRLPVLQTALALSPALSAVYAGYPNGDFLLMRPLDRGTHALRDQAPAEARYLVQSIAHDQQGRPHGEWRFYDAGLRLLQRQARPDHLYDPRSRPWFGQAQSSPAPVLTTPYVFFTTGQTGVSLALRSREGGTVFGMDAAVEDLSLQAAALRMTPGTEIAVLDREGQVFVHHDPRQLLVEDQGRLRLAHLDELASPSLARLQALRGAPAQAQAFTVQDAAWYGIRRPLATFDGAELLVAIPQSELFVGVRRMLIDKTLLATALILPMLLGGWWLGWSWLDPLMGLVGAVLVAVWAKGLLTDTGKVLLDREMDHPVVDEIRSLVDDLPYGTEVTDLHVWRVGNGAYACAISLLTHDAALTPLQIREALGIHEEIVHVTVEIHRCDIC